MRFYSRKQLAAAVLSLLSALALAGCAAGFGGPALLVLLLSTGGLVLAGCGSSHGRGEPRGDAGAEDAGTDGGGTWESCCVDGVIDTCYCPPMTACNYGWYTDCGGGTCSFEPDGCYPDGGGADAGPADAGTDAGGTWESCCVDGVIDTCYCPPGAACNYGWYTDCGGGTCAFGPDECAPDGGVEDGSVTFLDAGSAP